MANKLEAEAREWYNAQPQNEGVFKVMAAFALKKLEAAHREASIIEMDCNENCHLEIAERIRALMDDEAESGEGLGHELPQKAASVSRTRNMRLDSAFPVGLLAVPGLGYGN